MSIEPYLEDLEKRIDPDVEDSLIAEWRSFADGKMDAVYFSPRRGAAAPPAIDWPRVGVNRALGDFEQMALQQLGGCSAALDGASGAPLSVRCNYGTGILSSVFGAEIFVMDPEFNTLPITRSLSGGSAAVERLLDNGVPDLDQGYGGKTFTMGHYFIKCMADYPKVSRYVHIYHPDLQGPMDICELLWGSGLFVELIEKPDLVKAMLQLIVDTYVRFMHRWIEIVPPLDGIAVHWNLIHKGAVMLRDDSAMNLSPEMFEDFILPYDQQLLDAFGGGAVHFCGRGDHFIEAMGGMRGLYAVNLSQPEYNDMEKIFANTVDRGINLVGLRRETVEKALKQGRELHGLAHCA